MRPWNRPWCRSTPTIDYQHAIGAGTGFVLNPNGEVLTNFHVVQGADVITAHSVGTGQSFPVDLVGYDRTHDIALLQLRGAGGLPVAPLGNSASVVAGEPAVAIGNANPGSPPTREAGTITSSAGRSKPRTRLPVALTS